ncbi:hypothetical protein GJAV_G00069400 [Gymnothorax javanicus]|nr:hypothetical protein GJAV_G00069400 [Gymnothorax javanicus]
MESPTKEIEDFENNSLKYLQPEQIEKIWLRLRGLRKYKKTSQRLRCLVKQLERGEASVVDLKKNLEYAASVLESVYIEETRCVHSLLPVPVFLLTEIHSFIHDITH